MIPSGRVERWNALVKVTTLGLIADEMLVVLERVGDRPHELEDRDREVIAHAREWIRRLFIGWNYFARREAVNEVIGGEPARFGDDYLIFVDAVRNVPGMPPLNTIERLVRVLEAGEGLTPEDKGYLVGVFTLISDYATACHNRLAVSSPTEGFLEAGRALGVLELE